MTDTVKSETFDHNHEVYERQRVPTPPSRTPSALAAAAARRSRRNSVQTACERCRRRKIRCSGLPGPCTSCSRLNVACHDPGKRKERTQSLLEDRIQRLEALASANNSIRHESVGDLSLCTLPAAESLAIAQPQPQPPHMPLLQTENLMDFYQLSREDFGEPSPLSTQFSDYWAIPRSPTCHSEQSPDMSSMWSHGENFQPYGEKTSTPMPPTHRRAHTFPVIETQMSWQDELSLSAGAFSDIPSIEITSHDFSRPQSPFDRGQDATSPVGFSIPYRSTLADQDDDLNEISFDLPRTPPLFALDTRHLDESSPIEYYGERLSPLDRPPPPLSRRSSVASSAEYIAGIYNTSHATSPFALVLPSRTRVNRSQTLPCTITNEQESRQYINMTINSPRTWNYISIYFNSVHADYPFLDPHGFTTNRSLAYRASGLRSDISQRRTTIPDTVSSYQTLLVAAIGAMIHHQSRSLSSRHVRHAMTLHPQIDMWSSVSGLHCAMLLSIYIHLEQTLSFNDEFPDLFDQKPHLSDPAHPHVNLWLHNCQVAATCVDLGLHVSTADDGSDGIDKQTELCTNTLRAAYLLDRRISVLKKRPRAFHDDDLDADLIRGL